MHCVSLLIAALVARFGETHAARGLGPVERSVKRLM